MFKVFIDDSGGQNYTNPFAKEFIHNPPAFERYEDFWRDNYFVLAGVRVANMNIGDLNTTINEIKKKHFGSHKVEIKSDWIRNKKRRKKFYLDPYGITDADIDAFGQEILSFIEKERKYLQIIATVFDKRYYGDKKRNSPDGNILAKSTQVLLERIHLLGSKHEVIFDQMMSNLKLTEGRHKEIIEVWKNTSGMKQIHVKDYSFISSISFKKSSQENFIQIADICSYIIYRQFVHYGRDWLKHKGKSLPTYDYFDKIRCNFISNLGKVTGVGLVCIPDIKKNDWDIFEDCDKR